MRSFHARRVIGTMVAGTLLTSTVMVAIGGQQAAVAVAARPTAPQRINLTLQDLEFILAQIQIGEAHPFGQDLICTAPDALTNPVACTTSIPNVNRQFGLRQTDGQHNNLVDGRSTWGSADQTFPRITKAVYKDADGLTFDPDGPGGLSVGDPTSYQQNSGIVADAQPRVISNLISDQTEHNPAAVAAAAETQGHGFGATSFLVDHDRNPDTPKILQYSMPNVAPDAGFSASYNSLFTLFGQFFDHGLDLAAKGDSGTVFVPLQPDDPLYVPGSPSNFMVLTRATNGPGPDGVLGTDDDVKDATNQVTPYIDNNQTYTSTPSHQVFLREYALDTNGLPVATGRLLTGADGGLPTWQDVKDQAENLLRIHLVDTDVNNVPTVLTDVYGRFLPGVTGYPQLVMPNGTFMDGDASTTVSPSEVGSVRTGHSFLNDIAHHAAPGTWDHDHNPGTPAIAQTADTDPATTDDHLPGTYDDEMLGAHYICGDGRCNENIGLTAIHDVFHSEHNLLVEQLEDFIPTLPNASPASLVNWLLPDGSWNGERIFQAAKFINEMEYQHIVFGEFARAIQPNVDLFAGYDPSKNPAITAEFAHSVYRFGHSMLTETMARTNADGTTNDMSLLDAFLNPTAYNDGGSAGRLSNQQASGSIIRGMVSQRGEEIDEFITEALRNNLVGLPLDLGTLNITRSRSEGIAPLNEVRRELFGSSLPGAGGNTQLKPYHDWADFGMALRHQASLVNFIAAYGTHPTVLSATTVDDKRAAAQDIVDLVTPDAQDFLDGAGDWANVDGRSITGLEDVDMWIGGLAEAPPLFDGMLGSTFNYVFETQLEALQNNDRVYYLARNEGLPLLTELEGNMFSDLVRRNTDAVNIPVMTFTRADYTFDLAAQTNPSGIVDDPNTPYNEPNLDGVSKMVRMSDGTIRLTGKGTTENHTTWLGTNADDKVRSAEGDDSLWGNDGNDRLEGGIGADMIEGNDGNDILTDVSGVDVISGGNGNDVVSPGNGLGDIILGDNGDDAVVGGVDDKEDFLGAGDDIQYGSQGIDSVVGGTGQDWVEGGLGSDGLSGDNLLEFPVSDGEDDVLIGGPGGDGYHSDGGMDIMAIGDGVDTVVAGLGFDFATYSRSTAKAFGDLSLPPLVGGGAANPRDRFNLVEGISGSQFDDVLRGDDRLRAIGHELTQASLDKIAGLEDLLNRAGELSVPGALNRFAGDDMVFGAAGADELEGGAGDDFIEGDASLDVHLECALQDGTPVIAQSVQDIQNQLLNGQIDPGTCDIKREISFDSSGDDTAIFRCPIDQYVVGTFPDGRTIVTHIPPKAGGGVGGGGAAAGGVVTNCAPGGGGGGAVAVGGGVNTGEGTDTLLDVEFAKFGDGTIVDLRPQAQNESPTGTATIDNLFPVVGDTLSVIANIVDPQGFDPAFANVLWQTWDGVTVDPFAQNEPVWQFADVADTYTVKPTDVGLQIRAIYQYLDNLGNSEAVPADPTAAVTSGVLLPPSATLELTAPATIDSRTVTLSATFLDGNGLPISAPVDFFVDDVPAGTAATDPVTGIATLDVLLTNPTDTVATFTAVAVDPAPLDAQFTTISSLPAVRFLGYPVVTVDAIAPTVEGTTGDVTPATVTFTLDRPAVVDQSITWTATGATATDGTDFATAGGTTVIPAGSSSGTVTVDVLGDTLVEGDETFDVTITDSTTTELGVAITQTATITDDDLPTLTLGADQVVTEGPGATVTFDLTLDQAPVNPVAVDWVLVGGTALPGSDYVDATGTAVFAPGQTTASIIVTVVDDSTVEFDENFSVQLGVATGANGPASATANALVQDDDVAVLSAGPAVSVIEGNVNTRKPMNFTLHLDRPSVHPISVSYRAGGGTATPRTDFVAPTTAAATGTVTIPAGATSLTVPVTVIGDNTIEPNETIVFSITGVTNAVVSTVSSTGTILDDDTPPAARIANASHVEGNAGFSFLTFTVTLSRAPSAPVSVLATTGNGTARTTADFTAVRTTVRFAAGQTTATVQVPIVGDRVREADEQFVVRLSQPNGVTIARTTATGTIVNDD
ncbi:MAG: peroxidase family protein [Ilumatobacteraceae bacterium]